MTRAAFDAVGGMDEGYFLYFEEADWQRSFRQAGFSIWHEPRSRVVHLVGQSTGMSGGRRADGALPDYWFDSRARYYRKAGGTLLPDLAFAAGSLFRGLKETALRGRTDAFGDLKGLFAARRRQRRRY